MKLSIKLLTSLLASTALAYRIDFKKLNLMKRQDGALNSVMSENCTNAVNYLDKCITDLDGLENVDDNPDVFCTSVDEKCSDFATVAKNVDTGCNDGTNALELMSTISILMARFTYLTACLKDESGKYCPISNSLRLTDEELEKQYGISSNSTNTNDSIKDQIKLVSYICESKACREGTLASFEMIKNFYNFSELNLESVTGTTTARETTDINDSDITDIEEGIKQLKEDSCVQKAESNDAASLTKISGILITLGLVFITLLA